MTRRKRPSASEPPPAAAPPEPAEQAVTPAPGSAARIRAAIDPPRAGGEAPLQAGNGAGGNGAGSNGAGGNGAGGNGAGGNGAVPSRGGYFLETDLAWGATAPELPWPDAKRGVALPLLRESVTGKPRLDVSEIFRDKNVMLIGSTGFVGKVALSMLLHRYPEVGRVYCLVRPGAGNTADERFYKKVAASEVFDPVREVHGDDFEPFLRSKIIAVPGDIGRPLCNFSDEQFADFERVGGLHLIINSAGLVSFAPSLESALRINAMGAKNVLDAARRAGARLCHVSTCYVAGKRDGDIWEDEPIIGYFPRSVVNAAEPNRRQVRRSHDADLLDRDFDPAAEIADCQKMIDQARERSNDRQHISQFRERGAAALRAQRRDPDDENDLKLAVARERKIWMNEVLTKLGVERAEHWGWTNTYTYTKSLGEQIILSDPTVTSTIVRPAIVESSIRYPFPGWNEGFNTTAPLMYLMLKGHRAVPMGEDTALDVIPVDFIASGMLLAAAAVLAGEHEPVYQLGSSDANRITSRRLAELTGLAVRQVHRDKAARGEDEFKSRLRARLESGPVTHAYFERWSAPMFKRVADRLIAVIDEKLPRWGAPRLEAVAERARDELEKISTFTGQIQNLIDLFKPFTTDHDISFRCDHIRALWARVSPADQDKLLWAPHLIDWRRYWLNTHFPGLQKWTFDKLDEEFGAKPKSVYTYKELVELFEAAVKLHRNRTALRLIRKRSGSVPLAYTYGQIGEMARKGAEALRRRGVAAGDRVVVMSENRPEWGIAYFAILLAGATAVPLDRELSLQEVENLARASHAKAMVLSRKVAERLASEAEIALPETARGESESADAEVVWSPAHPAFAAWLARKLAGQLGDGPIDVLAFDELWIEPDVVFVDPLRVRSQDPPGGEVAGVPAPPIRGDSLASLIFTSGTTGTPKGVMLTHKNLTSMVSKLSSLFALYKHDKLLSVLPLHHTLEFSAGFLMPLMHGASIDYLEELDADSLASALEDQGITGMVGVPALFQLLERKIYKNVSDAGVLIEKAFDSIVDLNRSLRDKLPWDIGAGKLLFYPVHRKLGGRMRLLITGGSALPADTLQSFRGLGFNLYEGYGMTESSPVLTVTRPGDKVVAGSVGRALPGIDVRIDRPDASGVGEVIAKGPNVMTGYFENPEATAQTLQDGWLHTGDLGRIDDDGNLFIVGRKKEMILGASGENVYPDELEELYRDSKYIKELSVVGLPGEGGHETVAALIVPDYEQGEGERRLSREVVREAVRDHVKKVGKGQPLYKRLKVVHLWDHDLPKTASRKVLRRDVVKELQRLERAARGGAEIKKLEAAAGAGAGDGASWLYDLLAEVSQGKRSQITAETRLDQIGFDSLMFTELAVALEAAGVNLPDPQELLALETVAEVEQLIARLGARSRTEKPRRDRLAREKAAEDRKAADDDIDVPRPLVALGRRALRGGMKALYHRVLETSVYGSSQVPPFGGYIVCANHASHLDTGLIKYALGEQGEALVALAARDYFFDDPVRRMYFENFTNLVPMERHGSLRESLRLAGEVIRDGYILLIFPEGTRSDTGVMTDFKPSLGYLAMTNQCGILPMYLSGTHDAMPKGRYLPKRGERVAAYVAPFIPYRDVVALAGKGSRSEQYRNITYHVESVIRRLAPEDRAWTLGDAGTMPLAEYLQSLGAAEAAPAEDEARD
jgi:long-chain acyl-CoA synthetase